MTDKLTEKQQKFLEHYYELLNVQFPSNNQRILEAARLAGYGATSVSNITKGVSKQMVEMSFEWAALHLPLALREVVGILEDPTKPGANNLLAAANTIMDRGGLAKSEKLNIKTDAPNAVIILPAKEVSPNEEDN